VGPRTIAVIVDAGQQSASVSYPLMRTSAALARKSVPDGLVR
jgi:hypothetical protein